MGLPEPIRRRSLPRRTPRETSARQDNRDVDTRAIELGLMHTRDGLLGVLGGRVQDIRDAFIHEELAVHGHFEVGDGPVEGEDLV